MTAKELKDFLNQLDLDAIQEEIEIVSTTQDADGTYYLDCDNLAEIHINIAAGPHNLPYISMLSDAAIRMMEGEN